MGYSAPGVSVRMLLGLGSDDTNRVFLRGACNEEQVEGGSG